MIKSFGVDVFSVSKLKFISFIQPIMCQTDTVLDTHIL
ncbi:hypothetical protein EJK55_1332 [Moraxella catarrhalis]|uniref:Uncharacterized protein n=1 Tax=Moraxella catarrhalis TaxID=480 RepID=A0ABY0BN87_MORCA|nr:hypothetical protein E9K_05534 [Moraxella catarrhalis 103P14B1]EGE23260.1 hypothetical protein E9Y_08556 [Moraxella catarrhalis 101P30B1]EGE25732.1 hypothetical protein E9W_02545 [Moraxella catarrhalis CO72]RUO12911.1 hypothetical protein EJK55_1332 [Moraxella catarrhalis]RUO17845.1 hypothetical protein EJK54_1549 [Moraxella catarrhalis]